MSQKQNEKVVVVFDPNGDPNKQATIRKELKPTPDKGTNGRQDRSNT